MARATSAAGRSCALCRVSVRSGVTSSRQLKLILRAGHPELTSKGTHLILNGLDGEAVVFFEVIEVSPVDDSVELHPSTTYIGSPLSL